MMNIAARYIDTCLPCYLLDGHNRTGETLVAASLCGDVEQAIEEMVDMIDPDAGFPEDVSDDVLHAALRAALTGVNLTSDEPDDDTDQAPLVYVVLSWS